jgi:GrpB-like predicted nucleotidyltransferase (UPF0157 family)
LDEYAWETYNNMTAHFTIVGHDIQWSDEFQAIAEPLRASLGVLALRIDHIGSTSVPRLAAKDIIDIQVTVAALNEEALSRALAPLGYTLAPENGHDHVPPGHDDDAPEDWRKLYFRPPTDQRDTHLHVRQAGRANQRYALLFRDYLRVDPVACGAYERIKRALARLHPDDVEAYYDVKDPVCDIIIAAAERWASATGYEQGTTDA